MKYITLIIGLLVLGCGKKDLTKENVVGVYEGKDGENTIKVVILENGVGENYFNGEKINEGKWKVVGREVHVESPDGDTTFSRIEPNGDLTLIAALVDGERKDAPKEAQLTLRKIKAGTRGMSPTDRGKNSIARKPVNEPVELENIDMAKKPVKELTLGEKKAVGTYEDIEDEDTHRVVILENGVFEDYLNGDKDEEGKWTINIFGEMHVEWEEGPVTVCRINEDGSITVIATIINKIRIDIPKEEQDTYKKIK